MRRESQSVATGPLVMDLSKKFACQVTGQDEKTLKRCTFVRKHTRPAAPCRALQLVSGALDGARGGGGRPACLVRCQHFGARLEVA